MQQDDQAPLSTIFSAAVGCVLAYFGYLLLTMPVFAVASFIFVIAINFNFSSALVPLIQALSLGKLLPGGSGTVELSDIIQMYVVFSLALAAFGQVSRFVVKAVFHKAVLLSFTQRFLAVVGTYTSIFLLALFSILFASSATDKLGFFLVLLFFYIIGLVPAVLYVVITHPYGALPPSKQSP